MEEALTFGNNKGVNPNYTLFQPMMEEDVTRGFSLIIPLEKITKLKGVIIAPMNIAEQKTINERGEIIGKKRLTHNQSFNGLVSGTSVNSRLIEEDIQQVMYARCLKRILHHIITLRKKYP